MLLFKGHRIEKYKTRQRFCVKNENSVSYVFGVKWNNL